MNIHAGASAGPKENLPMITRILCASALVAIAGSAAYAQQARAGVFTHDDQQPARVQADRFTWVASSDDDAQPQTITIEKNDDTVLVYTPSTKGGTRVSFSDGPKVVELRVAGDRIDDLEVMVDGRKVEGNTAKLKGGRIYVLDAEGHTIADFNAPSVSISSGGGTASWSGQGQARADRLRSTNAAERRALNEVRAQARGQAAPARANRRVIGITASTPSEALAAQLGLDADKVIVVESVADGMPAAKAGLKRFDIITKVEGAAPANIGRLSQVIESKKDDEPIHLTIVRSGKEQQVELRPVVETQGEWQIEINDDEDMDFEPFSVRGFMSRLDPDEQARVEEAMAGAREALAAQQERLAELRTNLANQAEDMARQLHEQLQDSGVADEVREAYQDAIRELGNLDLKQEIERAMVEVQRAMKEVDSQGRTLNTLPEIRFFDRGQGANGRGVVVAPTPPAPPAAVAPAPAMSRRAPAADDARLQALEERMARIEALLERLANNRDDNR